MIMHTGPCILTAVQKFKLLKIQGGGWPPFWKPLIWYIQNLWPVLMNLVQWCF